VEIGRLKLYTALYHAANYGHYEATKYLLELRQINLKNDPNNILHMVCFGKWHENENYTVEIIKYMLAAGADINKVDKSGDTPLNIACGRAEAPKSVQEFLIANGAKEALLKKEAPQIHYPDLGHPLYRSRWSAFSSAFDKEQFHG
jgi:ankyrin repeat protein